MGTLVDTSVFVAAERGEIEPDRFEQEYGESELFLGAITASELLHGVHRLRASKRKVAAQSFVELILERIPVIPFDLVSARAHAHVGADLARKGVTVGAHDLLIGATALAHGHDVLTRDRRSFARIPDLEVRTC